MTLVYSSVGRSNSIWAWASCAKSIGFFAKIINHDISQLALYLVAKVGNPSFFLRYNNLRDFATIKHLHLKIRQLFYL
jgi:hypothetical protein